MISKKVILTGSFGVGKTSLFNQFIYSKFSEKYLTTIGVKVNKRLIEVDGQELNILLWDIAGEIKQDKVPVNYFAGAEGILYVFDVTRKQTYDNIEQEIEYIKTLIPHAVIKIVGNKSDLLDQAALDALTQHVDVPIDCLTSAKTGDNVEQLFELLGRELIHISA